MHRRDQIWRASLGATAFVSTLLVLFGLAAIGARPGGLPAPASGEAVTSGGPGAPSTSPSTARGSLPTPPPAPSTLTGPSDDPDPVIVGAGDIADCGSDGDEATATLLDAIDGTVFTAGDNTYPAGTTGDFRDCFAPSWGRHLHRIRAAPGNHDWETGDLTAYRDYFGAASAGVDGASWYSYGVGTWQIIVLDSDCDRVDGCGPDSSQGDWLTTTLAASQARCTLAIWHHPRFSSGMHGDDPIVDPFWRALYAAGADLVVNGHDHDYERFAPQDPDGREDRARGLRQFVVGTGGVALRDIERTAPNSELRVSVVHGVLALTLRDGGYDWQFHPTTTDFSDKGTASCH